VFLSNGKRKLMIHCRSGTSGKTSSASRAGVSTIRQGFALPGQFVHQGGVVCFDELVEECLPGAMPFIGALAGTSSALCQRASSVQNGWTSQPVTGGWIMPHPRRPTGLSNFIPICNRLALFSFVFVKLDAVNFKYVSLAPNAAEGK
jgi:hypothetical protein